jgi:hypothetical protein
MCRVSDSWKNQEMLMSKVLGVQDQKFLSESREGYGEVWAGKRPVFRFLHAFIQIQYPNCSRFPGPSKSASMPSHALKNNSCIWRICISFTVFYALGLEAKIQKLTSETVSAVRRIYPIRIQIYSNVQPLSLSAFCMISAQSTQRIQRCRQCSKMLNSKKTKAS